MKTQTTRYFIYATLIILAAFILTALLIWISSSNKEIDLRNKIIAQQKNLEVVFDNTWKIISQQAQVTDHYKDSFKEIYQDLMESRYGEGDKESLMRWVTESNPNFDATIFTKLMSAIEVQRTQFTTEQTKLLSFKNSHDNIIDKFPSNLFVGGRGKIDINVITSSKTEEIFKEGREDNVKVF